MAWLNTFLQPFLCKRLSVRLRRLAAPPGRSETRGTEQQHTWSLLHSSDLVALSCIFPTKYETEFKGRNIYLFLNNCELNSNYLLVPRSQNIVPNIKAMKVVKKNLTAVYGGLRQYDCRCFHKHAIHWVKKDWEY